MIQWPSWPNARQWLFSLKAFIAAMLALYIALKFGLPRPYWAMATVYFVSNPLTGATRSKGAYRVAGTVLGATAAVVTVPQLVNMPIVLMAAIAVWIGVLLYLSMLERGPRSYVFLLAAYTLPIVALPSVGDPGAIFDVAVARIEEIVIGIVCAGLVGAIVFPAKVAPALRARAAAWLADAAAWASAVLHGGPDANASRHRLAGDILALDQLISQLSYDTESADSLRHARTLRERMTLLLPLLSALEAVLRALRRHRAGVPATLARDIAVLSAWLDGGFPAPAPVLSAAFSMNGGLGDASPGDDRHASMVLAAHDQLGRLARLCEECLALQQGIGDQPGTGARRAPGADGTRGARSLHHDHMMLLFGACSGALAVFCAGLLWIFSGWEDGGGTVAVTAIACCFFASIEEPRRVAYSFARWSGFTLLVASFYLFVVVPNAQTFEMLVGMLAVPYLGIGVLITRPGFNLIAMLLSVNTSSFANIQSLYDANFLGAFNAILANAAFMLFAPMWAMLTRPFGARVAAHRLIRASWKDLAQSATRKAVQAHARLGDRMLDRLGQLVPKLAASDDRLASDGFAELRVGYCALALQRTLPAMPPAARRSVRRVLSVVARHFRSQLRVGHAEATSNLLAARIDEAVAQVGRWRDEPGREALAALVVLRVTLLEEQLASGMS